MENSSDEINRRGIYIAANAFETLGFAFREQPTSDFGIDAHVEPRTGPQGTGQLLGLQIKSGNSYFREAVSEGWWLRTDQWHAKYWMQHALPVLIVQVDVDQGRVFWEAVTRRTVEFTKGGAKILIRRDRLVDESSLPALRELLSPLGNLGAPAAEGAECRVFLGRGISGKEGWQAFAEILVRQLVELECVAGWNIVIEARTTTEDDDLTDAGDYGAHGEDLASIDVNPDFHFAKYSVSAKEIADMDLLWDEGLRAEATADAIVQHLMAAEGMFDDLWDGEDEEDE
jgi:hypothetical protein